eukprot:CAMPEP_0172468154 /NCGR_PEP_ID=MMETSP1065-20121228/60825_1 /TAXON_ID=265537 /ORGANISM="Amphiprora paludosa, Strain CCMP125" /LENGTH=53 /DNA_ID=CAMNT_0013225497 /DNA_START=125 /DNA_END=282 /DNA_ORIENTATION=+
MCLDSIHVVGKEVVFSKSANLAYAIVFIWSCMVPVSGIFSLLVYMRPRWFPPR